MSYPTYPFGKIFDDVVRATGRTTAVELSDDDKERFAQLINDVLKDFWENPAGFWPGTFVIEQRTLDPVGLFVLKAASGETVIGSIDPEECFFEELPEPGSLYGVLGSVEDRGDRIVCFDEDCPAAPYIRFQYPCPVFTRTDYSEDSTYSAGDLVYSASAQECYASAASANTGHALTDTDWWTPVDFPDMAKTYVKWAASAELLSEDDGKYKQSARAQHELERLEEKLLPARRAGRTRR